MGDVLAITDASGDIVGNYEYDAWGKVLTADTDIAKQNPLRYRGYYYDNETGYYYLQSRYYDSNICRFINADAYIIPQKSKEIYVGNNLFAYCNNNSINNSDNFGMVPGALTAVSIGIILIALIATIGIAWALSTVINNVDYSFVANNLSDLSITYALKAIVIKTLVVSCMKSAYSYAKRVAGKTSKAISLAISIAVANAKVKTIMKKNKRYDYWIAYMSHGVIILGNKLSRNSAVSRIRKGLNVMSRGKSNARTAAYIAGNNRQPVGPERHGYLGQGYYSHYHIYKHSNNSHIFYT